MKDVNVYLNHIVEAMDKIAEYIQTGEDEFHDRAIIQDAVIRNLEIIGEAAKRVDESTRELNPAVPWKKLAGLHDILIHQYEGVDLGQVWRIASGVLPDLRTEVAKLITPDLEV